MHQSPNHTRLPHGGYACRDDGPLVAAIDEVLAANPRQGGQFRPGDGKVSTRILGQLMRATGGKANPAILNELLRERLAG